MPKTVDVHVKTMEAELNLTIQNKTTGKQFFDQVVKSIGLRNEQFFGFQYTHVKGDLMWIKPDKKIMSHNIKKEIPLKLMFQVKFYPENVAKEIYRDSSLRLLYLQVKNYISSDKIYCSPETAVLLASYAAQVHYGDYSNANCDPGFVTNDRLLPPRVMGQDANYWEKSVVSSWGKHRYLTREDAMMEYLKIAQGLHMYGVNYYEMRSRDSTEIWLGVNALGANIYEKGDKLKPKIIFKWTEIRSFTFEEKKATIKLMDKKAPDFIIYAPRMRTNKLILDLFMGNHKLYMLRRASGAIL